MGIKDDDGLSSEKFWEKSIKPIILIGKADGKDLLDASSLKSAGSTIAVGPSSRGVRAGFPLT